MILADTGPLVALLDKDDKHHQVCLETAKKLPASSLLTSWVCFTEAMYLLGSVGGYRYQAELWKLLQSERLTLHELSEAEINQMAELMSRYRDVPMDLADASLVAIAGSLSLSKVFTLDSDFYIYRLSRGSLLQVMPS